MSKRVRRWLVAIVGVAVLALIVRSTGWLSGPAESNSDEWFVVKPYLQLGDAPAPPSAPAATLELLWQGYDRDESWSVETQAGPGRAWAKADAPSGRRLAVEGILPRRLYRTALRGLVPGTECGYRVQMDGKLVFEAIARAARPPGSAHRLVVFGDGGAGTWEQCAVAYQVSLARPDLVLVAGDIVYYQGRMANYDEKFFPPYNSDDASPSAGAPLLRSVPFFAAPGNHDMMYRDLDDMPDALAYFLVWAQPLNGPLLNVNPTHWPDLRGGVVRQRAFQATAGAAYPRMANFSFDYGDVHWTVLDSNTYASFEDPVLRDWLAHDLATAQGAAWRFVTFHHPPFHSSEAHKEDQRTRLLVDLLQQGGVNLVFTGHVHNYERTYPLRFTSRRAVGAPGTEVDGSWELDHDFDGVTRTQPKGIIYLVTGAGGARLYDRHLNNAAASRKPFTAQFVSNVHSFTIVDVEPNRVSVRQVSDQGNELDRFTVTK